LPSQGFAARSDSDGRCHAGPQRLSGHRVIARDDATKHIPVIICTTKSQETDKIWGLRQGARDYNVSRSMPMICWTRLRALTASNSLPRNPAPRRSRQSSGGALSGARSKSAAGFSGSAGDAFAPGCQLPQRR
jgi:DNA-binding NarL/FixJ family response regulator